MNGTLVIGVGSSLAGDDAIGWHVATRLAAHPLLPRDVEVVQNGTDLLRLHDRLMGRRRIIIVDALLEDGPCGRLVRFDDLTELEHRAGSVHHLSPAHALRLLRGAYPEIRSIPVVFLGVTVANLQTGPGLSTGLAERLDAIVGGVLGAVADDDDG